MLARKGNLRKVALASILKTHLLASNESLAQRLEMNHNRSIRPSYSTRK